MRVFAPTQSEPLGVRIIDIEIDNRTDGIHADLILSNDKIKCIVIAHDNFRKWLNDNDRLELTSNSADYKGEHVQHTAKMGYVDYLNAYLDASMVYEYVSKKGLTPLQYKPE